MKEIRIAVDAIPLLLRSAGVKTYLYHWTRHLKRLAGDRIRLFPFLPQPDGFDHERSTLGRAPTLTRLAFLHLANHCPLPVLNWALPRADVFHASHQLLRPPTNTRVTATVYDLTCWLVPEFHRRANVEYARAFAEKVIRRAAGLIAISASTRADAIRVLKLAPERIEVIYPGVADEYFAVKEGQVSECRRALNLERPYILFVGTIEPRKNLEVLLDAWSGLNASVRKEFDLVIAGPPGWGDPAVLRRLEAGEPGVRYLGYVPEAHLPVLTAGAAVFVYPSLYEGFGLPLAQALACGVPAVTSAVSSLPEVAGEAALLVDPRSAAELGSAIARLLLSTALRERLAAEARRRAGMFRWEQAALRSLEFFARIA